MEDLRNREYNGWENRGTWLVHLHLSNEQVLFLEIAHLVASDPNDTTAGRLVEQWVRASITNWMNKFAGRNRQYDASIGLLLWDLLGAALAYTEWDDLVTLLGGGERVSNGFTMTLYYRLRQLPQVLTHMAVMMREAASLVAAADALKAWFEAVLAEWIDRMCVGRHMDASMTLVFNALLYNIYDLVVWDHVARAFRPGY